MYVFTPKRGTPICHVLLTVQNTHRRADYGSCDHSILVDANIMVSTNCPIIGEQVAVNFVAQQVTIATT